MKVLNVCFDDYANYSFDNAEALKSVGVDARSIKMKRHPFNYAQESPIGSEFEIRSQIDKADIVQFMHSDHKFLKYAIGKNKRIFVYHTGTGYRNSPKIMNGIFNPHIEAAFTDQTEFIGTGMKREQYIATAIDVKKYKSFSHQVNEERIISHFPSNASVKGTGDILYLMAKVKAKNFKFFYSTDKVGHVSQVQRMANCDIYVELFKPFLNGKPYGCYGVTAFEAAACGKVVVTQNIRPNVYANAYGDCPLVIANDENAFINHIERLLGYTNLTISAIQTETYNWVVEKHSYKATGERLKKLLDIK